MDLVIEKGRSANFARSVIAAPIGSTVSIIGFVMAIAFPTRVLLMMLTRCA